MTCERETLYPNPLSAIVPGIETTLRGNLMTLSDLSSIVGVISGLAVLGSLAYLSLQVRQTERNQRALMNQGVINRISENLRWSTEPHMVELLASVEAGKSQFTAEELLKLRLRLRNILFNTQDAYVQHNAGLLDQVTMDNSMIGIRSLLVLPVYRALWKLHRETYAPEWIAYIDKLIEETPLATPTDAVARFDATLAEVMR